MTRFTGTVDWDRAVAVAVCQGGLRELYQSAPKSGRSVVLAETIRQAPEIEEWMTAEVEAHTPTQEVASAVLARHRDLDGGPLEKLLGSRREKVALVFASDPRLGDLPAAKIELYTHSASPKVRFALAANDSIETEARIEALRGYDPYGEPMARLRNLESSAVSADVEEVIARLSTEDTTARTQLADSRFPEVLQTLVRDRSAVGVPYHTVYQTAVDGLHWSYQRRQSNSSEARLLKKAYMRVFTAGTRNNKIPSAALQRLIGELREIHRDVQRSGHVKRRVWVDPDDIDWAHLRQLAGEVRVHEDPASYLRDGDRGLGDFVTAVARVGEITGGEALRYLDLLEEAVGENKTQRYRVRQALGVLLDRVEEDGFRRLYSQIAARYAGELTEIGPVPVVVANLDTEEAAQTYPLKQLLRWPAEDVAAWMDRHGVPIRDAVSLDAELGGSQTAAEVVAVLSE